ncbi:MAG: lipid A-modifier LpxR family protein [Thiotrichales bacterium]
MWQSTQAGETAATPKLPPTGECAREGGTAGQHYLFAIDNDLLLGAQFDRDYTGGISLMAAGPTGCSAVARAVYDLLAGTTRACAATGTPSRDAPWCSLQFSAALFTPNRSDEPIDHDGDRPYASLLQLAIGTLKPVDPARTAHASNLSVGVLGSQLGRHGQAFVHKVFGNGEPLGWARQISDGGELTARWKHERQAFAGETTTARGARVEWKTAWDLQLGYLTGVGASVGVRTGRFRTPWWLFNPQSQDYDLRDAPSISDGRSERFWYGGIRIKLIGYNALLQGQFRESALAYAADELNPVIAQGWVGYRHALNRNATLGIEFRFQTAELDTSQGERPAYWGNVTLDWRE